MFRHLGQNVVVQRTLCPSRIRFNGLRRDQLGSAIGPMLFPLCSTRNPLFDDADLVRGQRIAMRDRRHALGFVGRLDATHHLGLVRRAWHDDGLTRFAFAQHLFGIDETHPSRRLYSAMTGGAVLHQNRPHVFVERNRFRDTRHDLLRRLRAATPKQEQRAYPDDSSPPTRVRRNAAGEGDGGKHTGHTMTTG